MLYVGIDPSFSKTGVCYFDQEAKTITFNAISPDGTNDSYKAALDRSGQIVLEVLRQLSTHENATCIIEEPLMSSFKASRLGILSGVVVWSLAFMPNIKYIWSVTPTYIARTNANIVKGQGINKKQASLFVALSILDYLGQEGYKIDILNNKYNKDGSMKARKLSHDEAEALILTLLLMLETGVLEDKIIAKMYEVNKNFLKRQTITLLKGEVK
jgi:Holliday junction resolvasome RuvABC endonuclease subunit